MKRRCATSAAGGRSGCCRPRRRRARCRSALEIYVNHYGGSFGNKWMWTPVVLSPALSAAGRRRASSSERAATTVLPALSALFFLDGAAGVYFHLRGA